MTATGKRACTIISFVLVAVFVFSSLFAYLFYLDLKKTFLVRLSGKASSLVGQQINIGDISFSFSEGINMYDIQMQNPQGFAPGQLLKIKKIALLVNYRELFNGKLHFKNIILHSPVLTVRKDPEGRMNISEGLKKFMTRQGTLAYQVDEFRLLAGMADFNNDVRFRGDRINLTLKDLSSDPGVKTSIEGDTLWAGENRIDFLGWAHLKDNPKKFNLSVSTEDFSLSPFKMLAAKYKVDIEKTKVRMVIEAQGDTGNGVNINSKITIRSPGYDLYRKDLVIIHTDASAFYDIAAHALTVNTLSVKVGNESVMNVKGRFLNVHEIPSYDLLLKLANFDLSAFNIAPGYRVNGMLFSDSIKIKGTLDRSNPELHGSIQIKEGSFTSDAVRLKKVNGSMIFSSAGTFSVQGEASAELLNAGAYSLSGPAAVRLSLNAKGRQQNMALSADMRTSPIMVKIRDDKELALGDFHVSLDGMLKGKSFSGKSTVNAEGLRYDAYAFKKIKCGLEFDYRQKNVGLKNLRIETDIFSSTVNKVKIVMKGIKGGLLIEAKDLSAEYPAKKVSLRRVDFSGKFDTAGKKLSGDMKFSAAGATFQEVKAERVAGNTAFNERGFSLVISQAELAGGRIRAIAQGKAFDQIFPVKAEVTAEHIDLGVLSLNAEKFLETGYRISGDLKSAEFTGTINSKSSLQGEAAMDVQKFAVLNKKTKRYMLKDVSVKPVVTVQGKDLAFKTVLSSGSVAATASGTVKGFLEKERSYHIQGHLKETQATDLRSSFWDVFPDSLLYAGLDGTISSDINIDYVKNKIALAGSMRLKDFLLEGENGEYSVGPVNGTLPFAYGDVDGAKTTPALPAFERSEFDSISRYYADLYPGQGFNRVTIGSLQYGYKLMKEITLWMKQDNGVLNVSRFSAKMFEGSLDGSAIVDMTDGVHYRIGMVLQGLSLTKLCDDIEPIRGYISGKVNGVALLKGSGSDMAKIIGRADLWTYATRDEKTKISREFLQKIGGPSIKSYLGNRNFDKGIMSVYIQKGFLIFRELEISNRNFIGIRDLSVKVAPLSNRIAIDHLMWTIVEAASRGAKK